NLLVYDLSTTSLVASTSSSRMALAVRSSASPAATPRASRARALSRQGSVDHTVVARVDQGTGSGDGSSSSRRAAARRVGGSPYSSTSASALASAPLRTSGAGNPPRAIA